MKEFVEAKAWLALKCRMDEWCECPVSYPDEIFITEADREFLIIQDVGLDTDDRTISYECGSEYRGLFNVSVMVPVNTWDYAQHKKLAGMVAAHFGYGAKYQYDDVTVTINQRSRIIGNVRLDNAHNRLELQIPWVTWG